MHSEDITESRQELLEQLRKLRQVSRGIVKAYITFACHTASCSVSEVRVFVQERHMFGVKPFQNPVKCPRCAQELVLDRFDAR
jgi:hypothetical protein